MGAWLRVRSLTGVALLLAKPETIERVGWPEWPYRPFFEMDEATQPCPWRVATRYWAEDVADQARRLAVTWPASLASQLRETLWAHMKAAAIVNEVTNTAK